MKVTLLVVGSLRGPLASVVREYEERASRYWRFRVLEVEAGLARKKADPRDVMAAEEERILGRLESLAGAEVVALTRTGTGLTSRKLARLLEQGALRSASEVVFVIGGAWGLGKAVLARAARPVSLSELTLPHEVARLVLTEQIYRAGTILRNEPYHKGP